ncbi:hypothetical protein DPMN_005544 [Dreissena polymorpha]|uniref:Uncharacterized protein n=1 Tax=Dreissena polymorpha TaxID=45954 RepID=A0A9D4MSF5_DREPO|nr:hypothetical protein DPMN_005544 [Dreissena polymorpha]
MSPKLKRIDKVGHKVPQKSPRAASANDEEQHQQGETRSRPISRLPLHLKVDQQPLTPPTETDA